MSMAKDIRAYDADWSELAQEIASNETPIELPCRTVVAAKTIRFKFYGFRAALERHDPQNPWLQALREVEVRCPDNPPRIVFSRNTDIREIGNLLKARRIPQSQTQLENPQQISTQDEVLETLLNLGDKNVEDPKAP